MWKIPRRQRPGQSLTRGAGTSLILMYGIALISQSEGVIPSDYISEHGPQEISPPSLNHQVLLRQKSPAVSQVCGARAFALFAVHTLAQTWRARQTGG